MTQSITKQTEKINPLELIENQFIERKTQFTEILPSTCNFNKFKQIVRTSLIKSPDLLLADRASLFSACLEAGKDGLMPDGKESALVVYNAKSSNGTYIKKVQYMPMIAGIIKKIYQTNEIITFSCHVIYENDEFDYSLGDNEYILHKPTLSDKGSPIGVYVIIKTKDNAVYREVMNKSEIEYIRSISKVKDGVFWSKHWGEMAKKTVIRRLTKRLHLNVDIENIIRRDDEFFDVSENANLSNKSNNIIDTINNLTQIEEAKSNTTLNIEDEEDVVTTIKHFIEVSNSVESINELLINETLLNNNELKQLLQAKAKSLGLEYSTETKEFIAKQQELISDNI